MSDRQTHTRTRLQLKLQIKNLQETFETYQKATDEAFYKTMGCLFFAGDNSLKEISTHLAQHASSFSNLLFLQYFAKKMTELSLKIEDCIDQNNMMDQISTGVRADMHANGQWAWHVYWHQQRYLVNNLLLEELRKTEHKDEPNIKQCLIAAIIKTAQSAAVIGNHYLAIFISGHRQQQFYNLIWHAADYYLNCAILALEFLHATLNKKAKNFNQFRILQAKTDLLALCSHFDNPEKPQHQTLLKYITDKIKQIKTDDNVKDTDISHLQSIINNIQHNVHNQFLCGAPEVECPYTTALNPFSFEKIAEEKVHWFFTAYQNLLNEIQIKLALPFQLAEQRNEVKAELSRVTTKIEAIFRLVATEYPIYKTMFDLLETAHEIVIDRIKSIELLQESETRHHLAYAELMQEPPQPSIPTSSAEEKSCAPSTTIPNHSASATITESPTSTTTPSKAATEFASPAQTPTDTAHAAFLPSLALKLSPRPQIKKLFDQAVKALKMQNDPASAILLMNSALKKINSDSYAEQTIAHAFLGDCLLIKITAHAKFNPKAIRHPIFTQTEIVDGKQQFTILETLQDIKQAILHVDKALNAIARLLGQETQISAALTEIILGLSITHENLKTRLQRIQHWCDKKAKEREAIKQQKILAGTWYNGKAKVSLDAQFYASVIASNAAGIAQMAEDLSNQAVVISHYLRPEKPTSVAAAAAPKV